MTDKDKKQFMLMMQILSNSMNEKEYSIESIRLWYSKLNGFDLAIVSRAFDSWINNNSKMPTPKDIIDLCKAQQVKIEPAKLPSPANRENNKRHAEEFKRAINEVAKPQRDHKAWARQIIANPSKYPAISLDFAREALK